MKRGLRKKEGEHIIDSSGCESGFGRVCLPIPGTAAAAPTASTATAAITATAAAAVSTVILVARAKQFEFLVRGQVRWRGVKAFVAQATRVTQGRFPARAATKLCSVAHTT